MIYSTGEATMAAHFDQASTKQAKDFHVDAKDIRKAKESKPLQNYTVMLINMTDLQIALGCYNFKPGGNNEWFPITPPVGRTCSSDYATCHTQQKFAPVWNCNCSDAAFELTLITQPDGNGSARGATWRIDPDCKFAGGSIGLQ